VTKEDVPVTINHAIEGLSAVLDQLQAAHVTSDGGTLAHAIESLSQVLDNLKSAHLHVKGGADLGPAKRCQSNVRYALKCYTVKCYTVAQFAVNT